LEELQLKFELFEGPLDLLLSLIEKHKLNIFDIPIASVLEQYMEYIGTLQQMDLEVASEFITMASQLLLIKSQMLLPKPPKEDPRMPLVQSLLEYKKYKELAEKMAVMSAEAAGKRVKSPDEIEPDKRYKKTHKVEELSAAYNNAAKRVKYKLPPPVTTFTALVTQKIISIRQKMIYYFRLIIKERKISFKKTLEKAESRDDIVASFLAVLELARSKKLETVQCGDDISISTVKKRKGKEEQDD